jgi:4-deoxy-L-threo-5-hexosulose-uronate ketol-isomerase
MENYQVRYAASPKEVKTYNTEMLRSEFLIEDLFTPNKITFTYSHYDRFIVGGAMPVTDEITLLPIDALKADYFLERRELGVVNVGGKGAVIVDGNTYEIDYKEAIYVGRGSKNVVFKSLDVKAPAKFYINSTPAHTAYPTRVVNHEQAEVVEMGSLETANARTIRKLIVNSVLDTCQLQMGMTELKVGSVWNTMPAHVHDRRMEVYFYFEVPEGQAVSHFMGQPQETRNIWMGNEEAVISPPWSIHCGSGTSNYTFIWGMAGENLDYGDMDHCKITELK